MLLICKLVNVRLFLATQLLLSMEKTTATGVFFRLALVMLTLDLDHVVLDGK